jgi:hypothetical protein
MTVEARMLQPDLVRHVRRLQVQRARLQQRTSADERLHQDGIA